MLYFLASAIIAIAIFFVMYEFASCSSCNGGNDNQMEPVWGYNRHAGYRSGIDGFGADNKPFEPDNSMPMQNPWDNIDYIVPTFII
jgi:hypothetical protein